VVGGPLRDDAFVDMLRVETQSVERIDIGEPWNQVWGGGIVPTSSTLLCGNPGSGKSTLLLTLALVFANRAGRAAYYVASEQAAAELKYTLTRVGMPLKEGQLRVLKSRASGANIDKDVLRKTPPSCLILDSITDFCGIRDHAGQVALCKLYRELGKEFKVPVLLIAQMNKAGDVTGMRRLDHDVDSLVQLDHVPEGRQLNRIIREYDCDGEDLRIIVAWKNRFGPTNTEYPLAMTPNGLVGLPRRRAVKDASKTGNKVTDLVLERGRLVDEIDAAQQALRDAKKELEELDTKAERAALRDSRAAAEAKPPDDMRVIP
jgi:DNA repair protein RadA/Sms